MTAIKFCATRRNQHTYTTAHPAHSHPHHTTATRRTRPRHDAVREYLAFRASSLHRGHRALWHMSLHISCEIRSASALAAVELCLASPAAVAPQTACKSRAAGMARAARMSRTRVARTALLVTLRRASAPAHGQRRAAVPSWAPPPARGRRSRRAPAARCAAEPGLRRGAPAAPAASRRALAAPRAAHRPARPSRRRLRPPPPARRRRHQRRA
mmetsp:Transcript_37903/g.104608  ORF Transcript_37903/g.104608 Transcript_37903/m.104608 type:complete len:213 (-) Transcript_37903:38-676(-)